MKNTTYILGAALIYAIFLAGNAGATSFLEDEAGISAYVNTGSTINLNSAESAFRTVETKTSTYIIGTVHISNTLDTEDVNVYVTSDGWIVAYYGKSNPVSSMMQWNSYNPNTGVISTTRLEDAITNVCNAISIPYSNIKSNTKYYDFRYPNANKLMIIADREQGDTTNTFNFKIPSSYMVYESSWSLYGYSTYGSYTYLDGTLIQSIGRCYNCGRWTSGLYLSSQITLDTLHTITVENHESCDSLSLCGWSATAIALVYREP